MSCDYTMGILYGIIHIENLIGQSHYYMGFTMLVLDYILELLFLCMASL